MENRPNPLLRRPKLDPLGDQDTVSDFTKRLEVARNPAHFLLEHSKSPIQNLVREMRLRKSRGSAAVNLGVSEDDKLPPDFVENKEKYENLLFSIFKQEPALISTYVESNFHLRFEIREIHTDHEARYRSG